MEIFASIQENFKFKCGSNANFTTRLPECLAVAICSDHVTQRSCAIYSHHLVMMRCWILWENLVKFSIFFFKTYDENVSKRAFQVSNTNTFLRLRYLLKDSPNFPNECSTEVRALFHFVANSDRAVKYPTKLRYDNIYLVL